MCSDGLSPRNTDSETIYLSLNHVPFLPYTDQFGVSTGFSSQTQDRTLNVLCIQRSRHFLLLFKERLVKYT